MLNDVVYRKAIRYDLSITLHITSIAFDCASVKNKLAEVSHEVDAQNNVFIFPHIEPIVSMQDPIW